jgi:tetratricopeptide (TPR) repeat protein
MAEPLPHPDNFHFNAAQGWLGLGNSLEAEAELNAISAPVQDHPSVVEFRFALCAHGRRFEAALQAAERQIALQPDSSQGWINRGNALFWLKRYAEACEAVIPMLEAFPAEWPLRYNLACYCVKLGKLQAAKEWYEAAALLAKPEELAALALKDPDMQELWDWVKARTAGSQKR